MYVFAKAEGCYVHLEEVDLVTVIHGEGLSFKNEQKER